MPTPIDKARATLTQLAAIPNPSPLEQVLAQTLCTALSRHAAPTRDSHHVQPSQALRRAYR